MEGRMKTEIGPAIAYINYSDERRRILLKSALIIMAVMGVVFSLINLQRGFIFFTIVEIVVPLFCLVLFYLIGRPNYLSLGSSTFVLFACCLCLILSGSSRTHPTVFIWNAAAPVMTFFLLGKRLGLPISIFFLSLATFLFLWSHLSGPNRLPLIALCNILFFMISIFVLSLYYETTREGTEKALIRDIAARKKAEEEKERLIQSLENALTQIKILSGLLPICSSCKKIRDDRGYWKQIESYIQEHSEAQFSHSICPECAEKIYPDFYETP